MRGEIGIDLLLSERRRLPVFAEKQLDDVLRRIGLFERMQLGQLCCGFCNVKISRENFGALFFRPAGGDVGVSCDSPECLKRVAEVVGE